MQDVMLLYVRYVFEPSMPFLLFPIFIIQMLWWELLKFDCDFY